MNFPYRAALLCAMVFSCLAARADNHADWMGLLPDRAALSELTIPGTHDAGALHEPWPGTATCQRLTIGEQLNAGVRFLDIRCRHLDDAFAIYHGVVSQKQTFDEVLETVLSFLTAHPTETVIMSVQQESSAEGNTRSFEQTFDAYVARNPGRWVLGSNLPSLGAARGKIVLFRRFRATARPKGIDASAWPNNRTFSSGALRVQDHYDIAGNDEKWQAIKGLFAETRPGVKGTLYVNFTSGVRSFSGIPNITGVSGDINARLAAYLRDPGHPRAGIVVMDFADDALCALLIAANPTPPAK